MDYAGPARIGVDGNVYETSIRIGDAEDPNWSALILDEVPDDCAKSEEVEVTLLGAGIYADWTGTAVVSRSHDGRWSLFGQTALQPPVGA
jgi:hypothetical protein